MALALYIYRHVVVGAMSWRNATDVTHSDLAHACTCGVKRLQVQHSSESVCVLIKSVCIHKGDRAVEGARTAGNVRVLL
jgi:hypothetical protein